MLAEGVIPALIERMKGRGLFGGRIAAAADLQALIRSGQAGAPVLRAHVIPSALTGGRPAAAAGAFIQPVDRGVTVLFTLPSADGTGARKTDELEELISTTIAAVVGWRHSAMPGAFRLVRAALLSMQGGTIAYQIDFAAGDQLRISP